MAADAVVVGLVHNCSPLNVSARSPMTSLQTLAAFAASNSCCRLNHLLLHSLDAPCFLLKARA
eukprot:1158041-Pelagomonas_calceolata.AAC.1